jgi:hypothetical protein
METELVLNVKLEALDEAVSWTPAPTYQASSSFTATLAAALNSDVCA